MTPGRGRPGPPVDHADRTADRDTEPDIERDIERETERDAGAATVFVVGFAVVLLVLAGLVVDGGLALNARQRVADDVEQAARAGSQRIDLVALRGAGVVRIDAPAAQTAARNFLITRGYPASGIQVRTAPDRVSTAATIRLPTALLSLVSIDHFTVTAQGQARPAVGITGEVTP
jgi:Flp pilus assembly protein TadG